MAELADPFAPLPPSAMAALPECLPALQAALEAIPLAWEKNATASSCLGAAIQTAAVLAAGATGGSRIVVMGATAPNVGALTIKPREDTRIYGSDAERKLYRPENDQWSSLAAKLSKDGARLDMFLCTQNYHDVATLAAATARTGGRLRLFSAFDFQMGWDALSGALEKLLLQSSGCDAVLRVRTSHGLGVQEYMGPGTRHPEGDVEVGDRKSVV